METCRNVRRVPLPAGKRVFAEALPFRPMQMATVTLKNVKKIYDNKVTAVHDFNLDIADKEFIVLVGPSGCGKSTTLRMIAGLEDISEGDLLIGGKRMNDVEPKDRDIAMVFQSYALYPHMTVRENIAFAFGKEKEKDFLEELLERFYLTEVAELYPAVLSGGQQQRTAMARMLAAKPDVILLDEPFSALDSFLRQEMEREVQQVLQSFGGVSILVSHNKEEIFRLTQKCMVMERGKIAEIGDTKEIFAHPKTAEGRLLIQGGSL